jgi:hypothetical protein
MWKSGSQDAILLALATGGDIRYVNMNLRTQTSPHLLLLLLRL